MTIECKFTGNSQCLIDFAQEYVDKLDIVFITGKNLERSGINRQTLETILPVIQQVYIDSKYFNSKTAQTCRGCEFYNKKVFKRGVPSEKGQEV